MLISCGRVGRIGLPSKTKIGLFVSWVYVGGATVASPVTIWSENTSDANNNITVKYNGVIAWITKKIAGVSTYVTLPATLSAGTYPVKIILNADNTMQLIVNGIAAATGLGTERISPYPLNLQTQAFSVSNASIISGTQFNAGTTANAFCYKSGLGVPGRIYSLTAGGAQSSGILYITDASTGTILANANSTVVYQAGTGGGLIGYRLSGHSAAATVTGCTYSVKEVQNNTTTTAIPWITVL